MARFYFGKDEELHCITDVKLIRPDDPELCLAYKTSTFSIFAPLYLHDDGYVLAVKSQHGAYYELPRGQELAEFQASGSLRPRYRATRSHSPSMRSATLSGS